MSCPADLHATPAEVEASQRRFALAEDTTGTICVVGAGLTGIEAAKVFKRETDHPVVILERGTFMGGIWVWGANPESCVQVDPISFAPVEDTKPIRSVNAANPFESMAFNRGNVLARICDDVKAFGIKDITVFGVEVVGFTAQSSSAVVVDIRLSDGNVVQRTFKELHIRVGNLLKPRMLRVPGEDTFKGVCCGGVSGDLNVADFEGKRVTIVGSGAFAIENVRRALMGGAKTPVVVLTREFNKCMFPEYATYHLRHTLSSYRTATQCQDDLEASTAMWRRTVDIISKVAGLCGLQEKTMGYKSIRTINGEKHILFNRAIPPMSSNLMYLGYYYGLVQYEEDEVASCRGNEVVTKKGVVYPTDVFVKCIGFDDNDGLLASHVCTDAYFVDNHVNVTHNCRGDRVNGSLIFGPHAQCRNFLISYYEDSQEYERTLVVLNKRPELFERIRRMDPQRYACDISMVDYFTTIVLSDKMARLDDDEFRAVLEQNMRKRQQMYQSHLTEEKFLALDGAYWEKLSRHFHALSGQSKPFLPYPFPLEE